jgi:hypothetical protein
MVEVLLEAAHLPDDMKHPGAGGRCVVSLGKNKMIKILEQSTETCLVVSFCGKITGDEYQQFLDAIEERLKTREIINLVCGLEEFDFYGDFESAKKDFKFGFGEYKHIHRLAFVGDQKWITWFTRLIDPFTRVEEKHFPANQFENAFFWASEYEE